jgi:hypothetical protein
MTRLDLIGAASIGFAAPSLAPANGDANMAQTAALMITRRIPDPLA